MKKLSKLKIAAIVFGILASASTVFAVVLMPAFNTHVQNQIGKAVDKYRPELVTTKEFQMAEKRRDEQIDTLKDGQKDISDKLDKLIEFLLRKQR